jgi:regulator of cell morphogenesis and NO signaling
MMTPDSSLADLALAHPSASRVLRQHRLDFCCGGGRSIREACAERGLDASSLLEQITAELATRAPRDFQAIELPELIEYIVTRFHQAHRLEFPELIELANKVERVHASNPAAPRGLAAHLSNMARALEEHMQREEQGFFPAILRGRGQLDGPVILLSLEHEEHGRSLAHLRALAHDFVPPAGACTSFRALYLRCEQLEADLMEHVHLENHVLFPRVSKGVF